MNQRPHSSLATCVPLATIPQRRSNSVTVQHTPTFRPSRPARIVPLRHPPWPATVSEVQASGLQTVVPRDCATSPPIDNFVMYIFEDDTTVIPKETGWFEDVNNGDITPLRARKLYEEDWIGLRALDRKGGLTFKTTPGDHMQLSDKVLTNVFSEYFGPHRTGSRTPNTVDEL
ncbi:hypothetical protein NUW58_g5154 [Xylaria curta]|uniref:Uncharacterized protein n=1 Tax=Xylaria curta TaxID=42375 RepID=A0ACC1P491_9PEZI|nr:hypothetical protein NUW58_g5154 [Xylaria curta]